MPRGNEVHKAVAMLLCEEGAFPSRETLKSDFSEAREADEAALFGFIYKLPKPSSIEAEELATAAIASTTDEAFERGFRAGIRFIIQAMGGDQAYGEGQDSAQERDAVAQ